MNELALTAPYIYYQFKNATGITTFLDGYLNEVESSSIANLENVLNIDTASGFWLDQIGLYLNYGRPLIISDTAFGYDSLLGQYDDFSTYDAAGDRAGDDLYRILLKAYILKRNSNYTIESVCNNIKTCLGVNRVFIQESDKNIDITCIAYNNDIASLLQLLNSLDNRWFGLPTGVGINSFIFVNFTDIEDNIFILDFSKLDNEHLLFYE
jgi:hypothetical protein